MVLFVMVSVNIVSINIDLALYRLRILADVRRH